MRFLLSIVLLFAVNAVGTIIVADSGSRADVGTAVNSAVDGDIVKIPSGSNYWTYSLIVTQQIIIMAEDYTPTEQPFTNATRNVTITWAGTTNYAIHMTSGNSNHCGVGGIKFMPETFDNVDDNEEAHDIWGVVHFSGSGTKVPLVFDCHFQSNDRENVSSDEASFLTFDGQGGVVWNTCFDGTRAQSTVSVIGMGGAGIHIASSRSFQTTPTKGTDDTDGIVNVYFEDCYWYQWGQADVDLAGRAVIRYSTLDSSSWQTHGDTSGVSGRHVEMYNNAFENTPTDRNFSRYFWCRGGTVYFTENSVSDNNTGYGAPSQLQAVWEGGGTYLVDYQPGCGHNGSAFVVEPMYIWNQTGPSAYAWGNSSPSYVFLGTNIFVNSSTPTYTKYTYPHPAREYIEGDVTPPTLTSATIPSAGTTISLAFDETVNIGSGGNAGWTLDLSGGACTMTYSIGDGSSTLVYSLSRTVEPGETGTIDYTQPTDGVEDNFGNDLASIADDTVTNNSSEGGDPPIELGPSDTFTIVLPGDRHSARFDQGGYRTNWQANAAWITNNTSDGFWNVRIVIDCGDIWHQDSRYQVGGANYTASAYTVEEVTNDWAAMRHAGIHVWPIPGNHDADDPTATAFNNGSYAGANVFNVPALSHTNVVSHWFLTNQTGFQATRTTANNPGRQYAMTFTNNDFKILFASYHSSITGGVSGASEVLPQSQWISTQAAAFPDHHLIVSAHFLLTGNDSWGVRPETGANGPGPVWPRFSYHDLAALGLYYYHGVGRNAYDQLRGVDNLWMGFGGHARIMPKGHVSFLKDNGTIADFVCFNMQSSDYKWQSAETTSSSGALLALVRIDPANRRADHYTLDVHTDETLTDYTTNLWWTPHGTPYYYRHNWSVPLPGVKKWRLR